MNIFLDTSVIYKDPFWKGNFFKELIEVVKEKEIGLFISDVVLMETIRNYGKIIAQDTIQLDKVNTKIEHYEMVIDNVTIIDKEKSIKRLKLFYEQLEKDGVIQILNYTNDMLPEIVNRAIERRKPFTESKTELKDTIIWLTYSKYAEQNKLDNCIFLTSNVTDFCNNEKIKKNIFEIHSDLQKDSSRFTVYKSPKELIQTEKNHLQSISQRFNVWLEEQEFNNNFVLELLRKNFENEIIRKVEREYERLELDDVFKEEDYYLTGYISAGFFDIIDVDDIETDVFNEECIISGEVFVSCEVEGYEYNVARDRGEDRYRYYGEINNTVKLTFSFYYDQEEEPSSINLGDFEIV